MMMHGLANPKKPVFTFCNWLQELLSHFRWIKRHVSKSVTFRSPSLSITMFSYLISKTFSPVCHRFHYTQNKRASSVKKVSQKLTFSLIGHYCYYYYYYYYYYYLVINIALRYKPEGRGFDSRWFHWIFSLT